MVVFKTVKTITYSAANSKHFNI